MAQRTEPWHDNQVELKEHRENIFRVNHAHVLHKNIKCKSYRFATDTSFAWMRKRVLCALQLNVRARALLHIIPSIKMPLAPRVLFHKRSGHPHSRFVQLAFLPSYAHRHSALGPSARTYAGRRQSIALRRVVVFAVMTHACHRNESSVMVLVPPPPPVRRIKWPSARALQRSTRARFAYFSLRS